MCERAHSANTKNKNCGGSSKEEKNESRKKHGSYLRGRGRPGGGHEDGGGGKHHWLLVTAAGAAAYGGGSRGACLGRLLHPGDPPLSHPVQEEVGELKGEQEQNQSLDLAV